MFEPNQESRKAVAVIKQDIYYEQKLKEMFSLAADNREQIVYDE